MSKNSTGKLRGTVLEGPKGAAVALALAALSLALAAAQWFLLPDQVLAHTAGFIQGASYMPKWEPLVISTALGVGGAAWLGATRAKTGLALGALGVVVAVVLLGMNMLG